MEHFNTPSTEAHWIPASYVGDRSLESELRGFHAFTQFT